MFRLRDYFRLPEADAVLGGFLSVEPGLALLTGYEPRPFAAQPAGSRLPEPALPFPPSGRSALFRALVDELLETEGVRAAVLTSDPNWLRLPRRLQKRVSVLLIEPPFSAEDRLGQAFQHHARLLVLDRLERETLPLALQAARRGLRVLSQLDGIQRGAEAARQLRELGAGEDDLALLTWLLAVERLPALCPNCKQPQPLTPAEAERLRLLAATNPAPALARQVQELLSEGAQIYRAPGCRVCRQSGRSGDVSILDVFQGGLPAPQVYARPSLLPVEASLLHLVQCGELALADVFDLDAEHLRRVLHLQSQQDKALLEARSSLERKQTELDAANRVLQQRTLALISLEETSRALISAAELGTLAQRLCKRAADLCGGERVALYFARTPAAFELLGVQGWPTGSLQAALAPELALRLAAGPEPVSGPGLPPEVLDAGYPLTAAPLARLRSGLVMPLLAQGERVGLMMIHSAHKTSFTPGEVALLQTYANQGAMALQRAGLVEQLRAKVTELEAAQVGLAEKERMARELELARQVQQRVLPQTFPALPGWRVFARCEPARQVGGDFYDVMALDEDHFGIAIADVSDKGLPAALYMALTRSLLLAEARRERSPRQVLQSVNRLLLELGEQNMFVTVFYGVIQLSTRRLVYSRAGHDRPLLLRAGGLQELGGRGLPLGIYGGEEFNLTEEEMALACGDRLVLYTDGMTDVMDPQQQLFGRQRLLALCQAGPQPAENLGTALFEALHAYRCQADPFDDMTLLIVENFA